MSRDTDKNPHQSKEQLLSNPELVDKMLYTPTEAAQVLSISRSTIYLLMARGDVPSVRIGSSRRIPVDGLRRYVTALTAKATASAPLSSGNAQPRLWS
jgi:excisionase family DNA binding protein